jgi:hypothetical protein
VARLRRAVAPREATFAEVKDRVLRDRAADQRKAIADSTDTALRSALREGADLESLLVPLGGLRVSRRFTRQGPIPDLGRDPALAGDSTFLRQIFAARPGAALPPRPGAAGTVYAVVDSFSMKPDDAYRKDRTALRQEMIDQRTEAWTAQLRALAQIDIYRRDLRH